MSPPCLPVTDQPVSRVLAGRVAIVTGAGGGIGRAVALRLAAAGARVACVDIALDAADASADAVAQAGGEALALTLDISTEGGNQEMVARTAERFGGLDILHANAAVQRLARLPEATLEDWQVIFRPNLLGVGLGIKAALPQLAARGGGSVIITSSAAAFAGDPDAPIYGAMKGGLRAMCRSLAAAHGPENIRVNTICPGDVETPMLADDFAHQPDPEAARREIMERYPLRRFAQPEDVANLVAFLASDEAAYMTGIDIPIDGGLLARLY
jgi:NAD(P)-dependent dehydrogenase (short-subunit alcohol dehydrogenase family)